LSRALAVAARRGLVGVGGRVLSVFETVYDFLALVGATAVCLVTKPWPVAAFITQFYLLVMKSLPLIFLAALSTGAVMALQFGYGMSRFGGKYYVPTLVSMAMVRALGPIFTCLMIASRVGSGIAAEIGGMNVTQQVDALRALGSDPLQKLVVPRILALALGAPILAAVADLTGIFGGLLVATNELGIHPTLYLQKSYDSVRLSDILVGLGKTTFFAIFIGFIGCFHGLRTRQGTIGIGMATTQAVVVASVFVLVGDVLATKLTWIIGW